MKVVMSSIGEPYYTVLGLPVRILADNLKGDCPIAAVISGKGSDVLVQLHADGRYYNNGTSAYDIRLGKPAQKDIKESRKAISETRDKNGLEFIHKILEK